MNMSEIWKQIPCFSKYEVSTFGNVRNKRTLRQISQKNLRGGYIRTSLVNDDGEHKMGCFHRLVALTYIPNPGSKYTVNHINHDKLDNSVGNLEWASTTEQNRHKRKVPQEKQRLVSSRKVWRIDKDTNERLDIYETMRDAAKWVFDNSLTTVEEFNNGNNIKTKICAVCRKKMCVGSGSRHNGASKDKAYQRKTTFGYKWAYDESNIDIFENEIWKPIPKHIIHNTENYQLSNYGRIKNHKGRISEGYNRPNEYRWVSVCPKQYSLHILLAKVFLPNFYGKTIVNHKDGDKTNCCLWNLEWSTPSENSQHAHDNLLNKTGRPIESTNIITNKMQKFASITKFSRYTKISIHKCRYALKKNKLLEDTYKLEYYE